MKDEILKELLSWLTDAKSVIYSELPQLAKEIASWGFYAGLIYSVIFASSFVLCFKKNMFKEFAECPDKDSWNWGTKKMVLFWQNIFRICFLFIMGLLFLCFSKDAIQACVAPKLYVIKYLMSLGK